MVEEARVRIVLEGAEGERLTSETAESKQAKKKKDERTDFEKLAQDRVAIKAAVSKWLKDQEGGEFLAEVVEGGIIAGAGRGFKRLGLLKTPFGTVVGVGAVGAAAGVSLAEGLRVFQPYFEGFLAESIPGDGPAARAIRAAIAAEIGEKVFGGKDTEAGRASALSWFAAFAQGKDILDALTNTGITLTEKEASSIIDNLRAFSELKQRIELAEAAAQRTQSGSGINRQFRNLLYQFALKAGGRK